MSNYHETFLYSRSHEAAVARLWRLRKRKRAVSESERVFSRSGGSGGSSFTFPSKGAAEKKLRFLNLVVSLVQEGGV